VDACVAESHPAFLSVVYDLSEFGTQKGCLSCGKYRCFNILYDINAFNTARI
jgi:hypothetical protein